MSIDARIETVYFDENSDSTGRIKLIDRPKGSSPDSYAGNKGQSYLYYENAPHEVTALNGLDVWGGTSELMLGDRKIADRIGYTQLKFVNREAFLQAVSLYHERQRERTK